MRVAHRFELVGSAAREPAFPDVLIAAIVPCFNEEEAVGDVVRGLLDAVPGIEVYVYDNASTDGTAARAREAGAHVRSEAHPGKGNVVRRAFADIEADVYLIIDGDDTYDAAAAPLMIGKLLEGPYDHVLGVRMPEEDAHGAYRSGHEFGNRMINATVARLFGENVEDMLSGYRVMSRRFVKSFPASSRGFETETELTVHCLTLRVPSASVPVGFRERHEGSESKLNTYRDGWRILKTIVKLFRYERPVPFYSVIFLAGVLLIGMPWLASSLLLNDVELPQFPGIVALSLLAVFVLLGMLDDTLTRSRHDSAHLVYMHHPAPPCREDLPAPAPESLPVDESVATVGT